MQKIGWFGVVRGHSRSWAMPPFDRAHMTSYSTLIETMRLSCTVFEIQPAICRKSTIFDPPHLHLAPPHGVMLVEFRRDLWHQKTRVPGAIVWCCLCDLTFSRFSRTLTCDRHRQTDMDSGPWLVPRMRSIAR